MSELVSRCTAHDIHSRDADGAALTESVAIKLETLRVEVDGHNEVMAWIYEEA